MRFSPVLESLPSNRFAAICTPIRFGVARFVIRDAIAVSEVAGSEIAQ